jgi:two-component system nitrate/nitrite response regulator NarL
MSVAAARAAVGQVPVVLVDDSKAFLEAIGFALSRRDDIDVRGATTDCETAIYLVGNLKPQVAVVDIRMPGLGGIGLTRELKSRHPDLAVVALTVSHEEDDLSEMLRAGASGYVLKTVARDELPRAVHAAAGGDAWLSPRMSSKLIRSFLSSPAAALRQSIDDREELTPRERAVLSYVAHGRTNREIADGLFIAETTVKTHLKSVFAKLDVRNRSEAAAIAWRMGLAEVPAEIPVGDV